MTKLGNLATWLTQMRNITWIERYCPTYGQQVPYLLIKSSNVQIRSLHTIKVRQNRPDIRQLWTIGQCSSIWRPALLAANDIFSTCAQLPSDIVIHGLVERFLNFEWSCVIYCFNCLWLLFILYGKRVWFNVHNVTSSLKNGFWKC